MAWTEERHALFLFDIFDCVLFALDGSHPLKLGLFLFDCDRRGRVVDVFVI